MKKPHFLWMILLILILTGGTAFSLLNYFGGGRQKEEPYYGETAVVEKSTFDEFASEISDMVREYDGTKISDEALTTPYYSRRLVVQGNGEALDLTSYGAKVVVRGPDDMYVMQFTTREAAEEACGRLQDEAGIEYCEPDLYASGTESGEDYDAMSWGVEQTGAGDYAKHVKTVTDESITVAVVDSGVYEHSFLKDRIVPYYGNDFVDNDMKPDDKHGHGTHVAGTIVDCTPGLNVKILPVRVLDANNNGSTLVVSLGVRYAVTAGAQVMNISISTYDGISRTLDNAVSYAINRGCIVVTAAGNNNQDTVNVSPAHLERCIVVSSVDSDLQKADFSNWGDSIDFAAPGVGIVSCVPNIIAGITVGGTKEAWDGTSMAAPHISALAAMVKLANPSMSSYEVEQTLVAHCADLGESGWDSYYGWGMPDFSGETVEEDSGSAAAETAEPNQNDAAAAPDVSQDIPVQAEPSADYQAVLEEYKLLAERYFDSSLSDQILYANDGVWNFSGMEQYAVYYRYADLAGDGEPELLISINEKGAASNIVDIFGIENGRPTAMIESNESVGYRSRYYITTDNRVKNVGSGGALNTQISYYRVSPGSVVLALEDQYVYDGWDGDQYTHTDGAGSSEHITEEEYQYVSSDADVDFTSEWQLLYDGSSGQQSSNEEEGSYNGDSAEYILPDSSSAEISEEQLSQLSAEQLKIARNEIYARHGRRFDSEELQQYFSSKSWYVPRYTPEEFEKIQYDVMSNIEWRNIERILEAEAG